MEHFEKLLAKATRKESGVVPGAAMAVVNKSGTIVYKNVQGFNGVKRDATALIFDQSYFVASCTKLVTSIAALQCVERGLIGLDEPVDKHLPELAAQPIIVAKGDTEFETRTATKSVTLRHLVTHSSGAAYDAFDSTLTLWRQSRGENPGFSMSGQVWKDYAYPRIFESGEGWTYGTGLDWASLLISRLTGKGFEAYVEENISSLLGITAFTWRPSTKPLVGDNVMRMSERQADGKLADHTTPVWPEPVEEAGGAGMYSNVEDYTRLLLDLLQDSPRVLKKETVDQMFTPQFTDGSAALKALYANGDWTWGPVVGRSAEGVVPNHGLGGFLVMEDVVRENYFKPKGTLTWSGMPNLTWSVNRERGLAYFFATQVLPWNDEKSQMLIADFETAVWQNLSK